MSDEETKPAAPAPRAKVAAAPPQPAETKTPAAWAAQKGVEPFFLEGAVGRERAAGRWPLHSEPLVDEAAFDAAVDAFRNLSIG